MSREDVVGDVVRPSIPVLLWIAVAVWCGLALAETVSEWGSPGFAAAALGAVGIGAAIALASRSQGSAAWVVGLALCGGLLVGWVNWTAYDVDGRALQREGVGEWTGVVLSDPRSLGDAVAFDVGVESSGGGRAVTLGVLVRDTPELSRGMRVRCAGRVDDAGEWAQRDRRSGVHGRVSAWSLEVLGWRSGPLGWISRIRARAFETLGEVEGPGGDLLCGVLLGDRTRIRGTPLETDARTSGIAHLLAVSGTHLAVIAAFAKATGSALRLRRGAGLTWMLAVCGAYVLLTGVQPSSVRAIGVVAAFVLATSLGRRADPLAAVGVTVLLFLLLDPHAAFSVGLGLSALAMCGIVLFGPLTTAWLELALPRRAAFVAAPAGVCLIAQAVTLPLTVPLFSQIPVLGVAANLVAVPLVTCALPVGIVGIILTLVGFPGMWLLEAAGFLLARVAQVAEWISASSWAAMPVRGGVGLAATVGAVLALGWLLWPRPSPVLARRSAALLALGVLIALAPAWPGAGASLTVLDVGQGDAIVVRDGGRAILVDTGEDPDVLRRALARAGVRRLDLVLITHGHADHTGGLVGLAGMVVPGSVRVSQAADTEGFKAAEARLLGSSVSAGDHFALGKTSIEVLWPPGDLIPTEENDASLVLAVEREGFLALLTGDAEEPIYEQLAREGTLPQAVDVVKSPHHGSEGGLSTSTLGDLSPSVAVISVGEGNTYGHPSASALDALRTAGVRVLRTDRAGDITVEHEGDTVAVVVRAGAAIACETMPASRAGRDTGGRRTARVRRTVRPEARLPHPRVGGPAPRAGGVASQEAIRRGGRPRLQLQDVRWRDGRGLGHRGSGQHAAVHVRAPPRSRAQGRQTQDRRSERHRRLCG